PLEDREGKLKENTDKLADNLEAIEKRAEEMKAEANKADAGKGTGKPGENGKPSPSPDKGSPGNGSPGNPSPGSGSPGSGSGSGSPGAGSGSAKGAAQSMGQAQKQLGDQKPEHSLKDQDQAIEKLKATIEQLDQMADEARRELLKLPFELQAKK